MNGLWPKNNREARERLGRAGAVRSARALSGALLVALSVGCAHTTPATQLAQGPLAPSAEEARLERLLVQREQTIQQLEGRMAMLEASERALRDQLANARADEQARETVRIGARKAEREPVHEPRETRVATPASEPRPMLRLQGDKLSEPRSERQARGEPTSSWTAPVTSERLTVATVPRLSTLVDRPAMPPTSAPVAPPRESSAAADELYVHALDLLRRREFPEALRELDAFLRGFPGDGRVARAHFWRGEILFAERDFARALAAFEQALVEDPRGDKAADTLLRIARCQQRLGAHERARAALLKLRTQFPDSEAARVASQLTQEDT